MPAFAAHQPGLIPGKAFILDFPQKRLYRSPASAACIPQAGGGACLGGGLSDLCC